MGMTILQLFVARRPSEGADETLDQQLGKEWIQIFPTPQTPVNRKMKFTRRDFRLSGNQVKVLILLDLFELGTEINNLLLEAAEEEVREMEENSASAQTAARI